jgi:hypothetical protein
VDPYAHPQHVKLLKHFVYIISMRDAVYGGLEGPSTDQTTRKSTKTAF